MNAPERKNKLLEDQYTPLKEEVPTYTNLYQALIALMRFDKTPNFAPVGLVEQIVNFINPSYNLVGLYAAGGEAFIIRVTNSIKQQIALKICYPSSPGSEGKRTVTFWDHICSKFTVVNDDVAGRRFLKGTEIQSEIYEILQRERYDFFRVPKVLHVQENPLIVEMEWAEAVPSIRWLQETNNILIAMQAFLNLLQAVEIIHFHNIIHRDIKPANILIGRQNLIYIVDWTGAKKIDDPNRNLTVKNIGMGTAPYASPIQISSAKDATIKDDIYSLGFTFAAFVFGKDLPLPVNQQDNYSQKQAKYRQAILQNSVFPRLFHEAFAKATHGDPAQRYDIVSDFIKDLKDIIYQIQTTAEGRELLHLPDTAIPHYKIPPKINTEDPTIIANPTTDLTIKPLDSRTINIIAKELAQKYVDLCKAKKTCNRSCENCKEVNFSLYLMVGEFISYLKKGKYL